MNWKRTKNWRRVSDSVGGGKISFSGTEVLKDGSYNVDKPIFASLPQQITLTLMRDRAYRSLWLEAALHLHAADPTAFVVTLWSYLPWSLLVEASSRDKYSCLVDLLISNTEQCNSSGELTEHMNFDPDLSIIVVY